MNMISRKKGADETLSTENTYLYMGSTWIGLFKGYMRQAWNVESICL